MRFSLNGVPPMPKNNTKVVFVRAVILLLLIGVAALSTLARHSRYLPKSSPSHFYSKITKMRTTHLPVLVLPVSGCIVARIVPPLRDFAAVNLLLPEKPVMLQIHLSISLQHRSPPSLLA
jgi:hypothetical protein